MEKNKVTEIKHLSIEFIKNAKICIKKNRYSRNPIVRLGIQYIFFIVHTLIFLKSILCDTEFRYICYIKIFKSKQIHQTTPLTYMDRYPLIFSACRNYFKDKENLKILSYGCSTGEEVLTLRKYFPKATIVGAEINKHSLSICRKLPVDDKIDFIYSKPSKIKKYGKFDIIFCMAVLQRTPQTITEQGVTSLKKVYPFEKFQDKVIELDNYINCGGLLIIHYTQYSFMDTRIASKYKSLGNYNQDDYASSVFDKKSNLIKKPISQKSIFIKLYD